jgi:hypothetical protein
MANFNNKLYIGTMDWSYPAADAAALIFSQSSGTVSILLSVLIPPETYGADLYSFADNDSPAKPESIDGVGNYLNYGIRTMIANGNTGLLLGTANPMNLATASWPLGGWELIEALPDPARATR